MCYATNPLNPNSSSAAFNTAVGRPTGIGVDQSGFTDTLKANFYAYRQAMHAWNAGGNVGPKPINANITLMQAGIAAAKANQATRGSMSGGGAGSISRFGG
jgi:hypothetical protein